MQLSTWLENRGSGIALAREINVPASLVSQWGSGARPVPLERCVPIERATNGAVTRKDLRPDDWHNIWPELATTPPTTEPAAAGV